MSDDSYTEVTSTNWLSRIGNSFKGIVVGLIIILASSYMLYWNEGRSVQRAGAIGEAELVTIDMPDITKVDPSFNKKLVYAMGEAKSNSVLKDSLFGVSTTGIALDREVLYYQWVEKSQTRTEKKVGGGEEKITTYTYEKQWVDSPVLSSNFKKIEGHTNTVIMEIPAEDETFYANNVSFGAYTLSNQQVRSISNAQDLPLELSSEELKNIERNLVPAPYILNAFGQPSNQRSLEPRVKVYGNELYLGLNSASPQIGDMKVAFTKTPDTKISIIAEVNGNTFAQYIASNGGRFSELSSSQRSKEEMFQGAKNANSFLTWGLRGLGVFLVYAGLAMVLAPLSVIADVIPLLGNIVGAGTKLAAGLISVAWSFVIIAIAWIRFRPMLAIILIAIALAALGFAFWKGKNKKAEVAAPAENPVEE